MEIVVISKNVTIYSSAALTLTIINYLQQYISLHSPHIHNISISNGIRAENSQASY